MTPFHLLSSILRDPAVSSFRVEYADSSFLQNVGKSVPEHMVWHHITDDSTFKK